MHNKPSFFAVLGAALVLAACGSDSSSTKTVQVKVMTRNVYLGADLGPAIASTSYSNFADNVGKVVQQVDATNFPVRAKGLAAEILEVQPDLVGLQEVAMWRTGRLNPGPLADPRQPKTSTDVRYDFLELLLTELNAGGQKYEPAFVQEEFDFDAPADVNGVANDGMQPFVNAEGNARLTMRDVILRRTDADVTVSNAKGGHYTALWSASVLGATVTVARGWVAVDAKVRGGRTFRFVDTHLESFDPKTEVPSIRAKQATELTAAGGPANSSLPVILVGDLNSDDDTVTGGDEQAYQALLAAGFVERSTNDPLSCCIESSYDLKTGTDAEFDHQVDHVMTDAADKVTLVDSGVTGRTMQNGYWDSDHAGLWSTVEIR